MSLLAAPVVLADEPAKAQPRAPVKAAAGKAAPAPSVDEDFLEFLAWDSEDETWNEYLATLAGDKAKQAKDAAKTDPVKTPAKEGK